MEDKKGSGRRKGSGKGDGHNDVWVGSWAANLACCESGGCRPGALHHLALGRHLFCGTREIKYVRRTRLAGPSVIQGSQDVSRESIVRIRGVSMQEVKAVTLGRASEEGDGNG